MTTQKNHDIEDDDPNDQPDEIPITDALTQLLDPYEPVKLEKEADKQFTTKEIIAALEMHYGVPQGDTDFTTLNAGKLIVDELNRRGFIYVNTGDLQLQWLMKKKVK